MLYEALQVLTLMFALLLLLQSSVLAANTDTTVTVTLPTFAVALNDTKIDSAHSEYPLIVYRDITYFPMTYHASRFLHLKSSWYPVSYTHLDVYKRQISSFVPRTEQPSLA